jgi:hypothetical protein
MAEIPAPNDFQATTINSLEEISTFEKTAIRSAPAAPKTSPGNQGGADIEL